MTKKTKEQAKRYKTQMADALQVLTLFDKYLTKIYLFCETFTLFPSLYIKGQNGKFYRVMKYVGRRILIING